MGRQMSIAAAVAVWALSGCDGSQGSSATPDARLAVEDLGPPGCDETSCDDGNPCNGLETCSGRGGCVSGTPPTCDDDQNACNGPESCDPSSGCRSGPALACPDDGNLCNGSESCDPAEGCVSGPPPDCSDDGDVCNGPEHCAPDLGCVSGPPLDCSDDDDFCNGPQSCDPGAGCVSGPPLVCADDGDPCNGKEFCAPDVGCANAGPPDCDDGSVCTLDWCDPLIGCVHQPDPAAADAPGSACCSSEADCDSSACVSTVCAPDTATCQSTIAPDGTVCDAGKACTEGASCSGGLCVGAQEIAGCWPTCLLSGSAGETRDCPIRLARLDLEQPAAVQLAVTVDYAPDTVTLVGLVDRLCAGGVCTETVIPAEGSSLSATGHSVVVTPADPADWNGAVSVQIAHLTAPDTALGDAYFQDDLLVGAARIVGLRFELAVDVDASEVGLSAVTAIAPDDIDLTASVVEIAATEGAESGVLVTTDESCGGGICFDANSCTTDDCLRDKCTHSSVTGPCDDGNACTLGDACLPSGECTGVAVATPGTACAGPDACNQVGVCDALGTCVVDSALAVICPDPSPCTSSTCEAVSGDCIVLPLSGQPCDDGDVCTAADSCDPTGVCVGANTVCSDGLECTADQCHAEIGCVFVPVDAACPSGSNPCGTGICVPTSGCAIVPAEGAACDDGNPCTESDSCAGFGCVGEPAPECQCVVDGDCAAAENASGLCASDYACVDGLCTPDPASVVSCPPDGWKCTTNWLCDPDLGECGGEPVVCDDGIACTADSCVDFWGCTFAVMPGEKCPVDWLCELSGEAGDTVICPLRVARVSASSKKPTSATVTLYWDPTVVELVQFTDSFCVAGECYPFDLLDCDETGTSCSAGQLWPSGHTLLVSPMTPSEWDSSISVTAAIGKGAPVTEAHLDVAGGLVEDPEYMLVELQLLSDVPAAAPTQIQIGEVGFSANGKDLKWTLADFPAGRVFLTADPLAGESLPDSD